MERLIKSEDFNTDASFKCPKCGNEISPEDFSNRNYLVERVFVDITQGNIIIIIRCKCSTVIFLVLPIPNVSYTVSLKAKQV